MNFVGIGSIHRSSSQEDVIAIFIKRSKLHCVYLVIASYQSVMYLIV